MSKTRLQRERAGDQSNLDTYLNKKDSNASPATEFTNAELKTMFEKLEQNQTAIRDSLDSRNKDDETRHLKNEKLVETITSNVNRITENLDKIFPRMCEIENRITAIEDRMDSVNDVEKTLENLDDIEQVLPRIGDAEDRITKLEKKMEENLSLRKDITSLQTQALWEEYERKKQNLVVYGLEGSENENTVRVTKEFMINRLKLDRDWVDSLQLKSCIRLQGNGKGPLPLRISFSLPEDRDRVLRAGPELRDTKISLRTDLPKSMRIERAKLASKGYGMKKRGEVFKTRVREKGIDLWLEVIENEGDRWKPEKEKSNSRKSPE